MKLTRKPLAGVVVLAACAAGLYATPAQAALQVSDVVLTIGADQNERGLTWYGTAGADDYVQIAQKTGNGKGNNGNGKGNMPFKKATTVKPSVEGPAGEQTGVEYNQATLDDLKTNTTYQYRICVSANDCSATYEFSTGSKGNFNFLVYGDPQVYTGVKKGLNPSAGWLSMMDYSTSMFPNAAFITTMGDQVDSYDVTKQPAEWDAFLAPSQLTEYALAPNVGNHDDASTTGYLYAQHFGLPNLSSIGETAPGTGDYWYVYNGVLFMSLNSNSLDVDGHVAFMQSAIAANPGADWRIVEFHHAPYSAADHPNDENVVFLRQTLTEKLSALDVNLVLNGHDHDYARSYLMNGTEVVPGSDGSKLSAQPGEVLYIATNSASGGKYYDLTIDNPANDYYWAAVVNQDYTPQFTNVEVKGNALNITTYTINGDVIDTVSLTQSK